MFALWYSILDFSTLNPSLDTMEYFLLASYSCLPSVVARLEFIREKGQSAVLFCLTLPLYRFLKQLSVRYIWIEIHHVDVKTFTIRPLRNPINWWRTRRDLKSFYKEWFAKIPGGHIVHFYNRFSAPFLFYVVWKLKDNHIIHYTAADPVGLHPESHRIFSQIQKMVFKLIYSAPIQIVTSAGRRTNTWPALTDRALSQVIDVEHKETNTLEGIETSDLFQVLSWYSKAHVLWVMGLVLDMDEVCTAAYSKVLNSCIDAVNSAFSPAHQAVKYHPRAQERETGWAPGVEIVPDHIPAEFINLPDLKIVLAISSTAVSTLGKSSKIKVISLVELIPFRNEATRDDHRRSACYFGSKIELLMPATIAELEKCVASSLHDHENPE